MKRPLLIASLFIISISYAIAQADFRKGYVIALNKDTINGEIKYTRDAKNYETCIFRKNNAITEYDARQIAGYRYANGKYFTGGVVEGTFVETLIEGELSLYKKGTLYLVRKTEGKVHELTAEQKIVSIDDQIGAKEDTKWKGVLSYLVYDCEQGQTALKSLTMNERSLSKFVSRYNKCKGGSSPSKANSFSKEGMPLLKAEVAAAMGFTYTSLKVTSSSEEYRHLGDKYSSFDPSYGVIVAIHSPRITERVALQVEAYFTKSTYSAYVNEGYRTFTRHHNNNFDFETISIPISGKYYFPKRKYSAFMLMGINYDHHIKSKVKTTSEYISGNFSQQWETESFKPRKSQLGFAAGVGAYRMFGKVKTSILARYFLMSNLNDEATMIVSNEILNIKTSKMCVTVTLGTK